jgi:hypothetical protein
MGSRFPALVAAILAPLVWMLHLLAVYVLAAYACALSPASGERTSASIIVPGTVAATVAALAVLAGLGVYCYRWWPPPDSSPRASLAPFLSAVAVLLGVISALAIMWVAAPALLTPACR